MNAGLGVGALLAALIVSEGSSTTFVTLYIVDALSFLLFAPIAWSVHPRTADAEVVGRTADAGAPPLSAGFAHVLRDTVFLRLWLLTAALVAVGYAQLNGIFPAFVARPEGVSTRVVGVLFAVNTVGVVALQLLVLRGMAGRRRCAGLQLAALFWAATWALTYGAGSLGGGPGTVVGFILAAAVFAVGETFLAPSLAPMVNDLAPDDLRGRYNGLYTLAWTSGFAVGPAAAGVALERTGSAVFIGLVLVCGVIVWGAGRLDRHLVPSARLVTVDAT
jgi:MFS family permease